MATALDSGPQSLAWVLDAPPDWTEPRGLMLVGERHNRDSEPDLDGCPTLHVVCERFGIDNPDARALTWTWQSEETYPNEPELPESVALVSGSIGARVPLREVPRLFGVALTREGLAALGFVSPAVPTPTAPEPALIDAPEAARVLGITPLAFRQRVQRGQIPRAAIHRTGRRVQFVRAKLPGLGGK